MLAFCLALGNEPVLERQQLINLANFIYQHRDNISISVNTAWQFLNTWGTVNTLIISIETQYMYLNFSMRPAKTQISLGIHQVWSESSLSAWRNFGSLATHWAHSEDSDPRCPGWSESSLGKHSFCWLSCRGSNAAWTWGTVNNYSQYF